MKQRPTLVSTWPVPLKLLYAVVLLVVGSSYCTAQCDSSAQVMVEGDVFYAVDSGTVVDSANTIAASEIAPYFVFDFQQDSSRLIYWVGEFTKNSRWLYLNNWCLDKMYNYDAAADSARWDYSNAALSAISTTKAIPVTAGDTISFYRDFYWLDNTANGTVNATKLVSADEISTSVELVRASNGSRILLVDTVHITPTTSNAKPCITSWKPIMARIAFLVPTTVTDTTTVYLRQNVYSNGSSGSLFMRSDALQYRRSKQHLESPYWLDYASQVTYNNNCEQVCYFSVSGLTNPRRLLIDINNGQTTVDKVSVFDINGNMVHTVSIPTSEPYNTYVATGGIYVVVGYNSGNVVCSRIAQVP